MPNVDLSELIPESTLIFKNVPDNKGKKTTWTVPPFDEETELGFWEWRDDRASMRQTEQLKGMGMDDEAEKIKEPEEDADPHTVGAYWAPLIALAVKTPALDEKDLIKNFHSVTLKRVGQEVVHFFLTGRVSTEEEPKTEMTPES